jgi:hypothetical protein
VRYLRATLGEVAVKRMRRLVGRARVDPAEQIRAQPERHAAELERRVLGSSERRPPEQIRADTEIIDAHLYALPERTRSGQAESRAASSGQSINRYFVALTVGLQSATSNKGVNGTIRRHRCSG